ncbi:MAG: hypothetical protein AVDCRST_MAG76-77, partial [uncultured Acidimicrobiales bacterium]
CAAHPRWEARLVPHCAICHATPEPEPPGLGTAPREEQPNDGEASTSSCQEAAGGRARDAQRRDRGQWLPERQGRRRRWDHHRC